MEVSAEDISFMNSKVDSIKDKFITSFVLNRSFIPQNPEHCSQLIESLKNNIAELALIMVEKENEIIKKKEDEMVEKEVEKKNENHNFSDKNIRAENQLVKNEENEKEEIVRIDHEAQEIQEVLEKKETAIFEKEEAKKKAKEDRILIRNKLNKEMGLILGLIEGESVLEEIRDILLRKIGVKVTEQIESAIREELKVAYYGVKNLKKTALWEINDPKTLEQISEYFDIKEIKNHRKLCALQRTFVKSCTKFLDALPTSLPNVLFPLFVKLQDDERKLNDFKAKFFMSPLKINASFVPSLDPVLSKSKSLMMLEEASCPSNYEINAELVPEINSSLNTKVKCINQSELLQNTEEGLSPQKTIQKKKKEGRKKQIEPIAIAMDLEINIDEKNREENKTINFKGTSNKNRTLETFLVKKNTEKELKMDIEDDNEERCNRFVESINSVKEVNSLREEYKERAKGGMIKRQEEYFTTIIIWGSSIEYIEHAVQKEVELWNPYEKIEEVAYAEDSLEQYNEMAAEECEENEEVVAEEEEEARESDREFMVEDNVLAKEEISSEDEGAGRAVIEMSIGHEWVYPCESVEESMKRVEKYTMFPTDEPSNLPLSKELEEKTLNSKILTELYQQIHGSYGPKDALIHQLLTICDLKKSHLDTLIREISIRRNGQRFIKPEIIRELADQVEGLAEILAESLKTRNEEIKTTAAEKRSEKELKIEECILQWKGLYITELSQKLAEEGFKLKKKEIIAFVEERNGEEWQQVKLGIHKIQSTILEQMEKQSSNIAQPPKEGECC